MLSHNRCSISHHRVGWMTFTTLFMVGLLLAFVVPIHAHALSAAAVNGTVSQEHFSKHPSITDQDTVPIRLFLPLISTPARSDRIAFVDWDNENLTIASLHPDGTERAALATGCGGWSSESPIWAPDGQRLAFVSSGFPGMFSTICIVHADGSGVMQLENAEDDRSPSWSPDGQQLVFVAHGLSIYDHRDSDIFVMRADGSQRVQLTNAPNDDWNPTWSPDGQWIAFQSNDQTNTFIYLMHPDGTGKVRLTARAQSEGQPDWSPDSQRLTYIGYDPDGRDVYVSNRDGTGTTRLTQGLNAEQPRWSPDGTHIAFKTWDGSHLVLHVINTDGTELTDVGILINANGDNAYAWSPDSRQLVFETEIDKDTFIAVVNADGTNQHVLAPGWDPAWSRQ